MNRADLLTKGFIKEVLEEGCWDEDPRTRYKSDGAIAHSKFITQVFEKYDLSKGDLPITELREIFIEKSINEILWIYQDQSSDLSVLRDKYGIYWWNSWDIGDGTIGQRYGSTVRRYDLVNNLLNGIKNGPFGRRHIINLWQEKDFKDTQGLPPCAFQTMWSVRRVNGDLYLDMTLVQRSSDYLVSGHINMMQYVALQMMVAHECKMKVGKFARLTQNLHIYDRHIEHAHEMLKRETPGNMPKLILKAEGKSFYEITAEDFELQNYTPVSPQLTFDIGV